MARGATEEPRLDDHRSGVAEKPVQSDLVGAVQLNWPLRSRGRWWAAC